VSTFVRTLKLRGVRRRVSSDSDERVGSTSRNTVPQTKEGEGDDDEVEGEEEILSTHSVWLRMWQIILFLPKFRFVEWKISTSQQCQSWRSDRLWSVWYSRNPMSPIYLLWDSSCKLIIWCGTHPPELINYRPISNTVYGSLVFIFRCSSSTTNPVSLRRVDSSVLVFSRVMRD
jgi:hypothetical protein